MLTKYGAGVCHHTFGGGMDIFGYNLIWFKPYIVFAVDVYPMFGQKFSDWFQVIFFGSFVKIDFSFSH